MAVFLKLERVYRLLIHDVQKFLGMRGVDNKSYSDDVQEKAPFGLREVIRERLYENPRNEANCKLLVVSLYGVAGIFPRTET